MEISCFGGWLGGYKEGKNMLLNDNTNNVMELLDYFENLINIDKLRLAICLLENKQFSINYNTDDMINILKED